LGLVKNKKAMNQILLFVALVGLLVTCKQPGTSATAAIIGKWKLTSYLVDPGDGSGVLQPANPENPSYIAFNANGTITQSSASTIAGTYIRYEVLTDTTGRLFAAGNSIIAHYKLSSDSLTILPPCIEGCKFVYKREK
jgi:hypothetical protein